MPTKIAQGRSDSLPSSARRTRQTNRSDLKQQQQIRHIEKPKKTCLGAIDLKKQRAMFAVDSPTGATGDACSSKAKTTWHEARNPGAQITVIQNNAKQGKSEERYDKYKVSTSVGQFLALGGTVGDLRVDFYKRLVVYCDS